MTRLAAALATTLAALTLTASPAMAGTMRPVEVGRFAHFLDSDSVQRAGDVANFRYLMVTPEGFMAGDEEFWAGWSYMIIDCKARTADLTGFQSIRINGVEGPKTSDTQPGWPIASGSLEAALAEAVCDGRKPLKRPDAMNANEAVWWGRAWLEETE